MQYIATVRVTLRPSILDPQGKAAHHALTELGHEGIQSVRIGKFIELQVQAESEDAARSEVRQACEKLLSNPVMEDFQIELRAGEQVPA